MLPSKDLQNRGTMPRAARATQALRASVTRNTGTSTSFSATQTPSPVAFPRHPSLPHSTASNRRPLAIVHCSASVFRSRQITSASIPTPLSSTSTMTCSPSMRHRIWTCPALVNFTAFLIRFQNTCCRRVASPRLPLSTRCRLSFLRAAVHVRRDQRPPGRAPDQSAPIRFASSQKARFLKLQALSEVRGQPFSSVGELDVLAP